MRGGIVTLRVLGPDPVWPAKAYGAEDLAEQYTRVCINALAESIQQDIRPQTVTAPQFAPAGLGCTLPARPRVSAPEAAAVEALERRMASLDERSRQLGSELLQGRADEIAKRSRAIAQTVATIDRLEREISAMDSSPRRRNGPINRYEIVIPEVRFTGHITSTYGPRIFALDTHDLPPKLREWLRDYAQGGTEATPYYLRGERLQKSRVDDDTLGNLRLIFGYALQLLPPHRVQSPLSAEKSPA